MATENKGFQKICRFGLVLFILFFISFPISAQESGENTNPPVEKTPESPAPSTEPPPVELQVDSPSSPPVPEKEELNDLQKDLNSLREEIFRSKARTLLLQEFLVNTEVQVFFRNATRKDYRLISALYILDNSEIYKKEFEKGKEPRGKKERLIFQGVTTPGRHEISVVLTYEGKKTAGYTEKDYEFQVTGDFSFIAERSETTVITLTAIDRGKISKDTGFRESTYQLDWDIKVETKDLAAVRRRIEKRTVSLMLESGFMVETYQLVSDFLSVSRQTSSLIPFGARASWWFLPFLGVEGYYTLSNWKAKTGVNNQKVALVSHWFGLDAKLRYTFGRTIRSPQVWIQLGYNFIISDVDRFTIPIVRLNDDYQYLDVGVGTRIPFGNTVGMQGDFKFFPYIDLDESPLASGRTGNTKGLQWGVGFYWNFWKDLSAEVSYRFTLFDNDFTGRGNRTDATGQQLSLVQSRAIYQGGIIGIKYEF